ncbi:MAG: serine hydrolase, partial [Candidatus Devosia euplotis]|nr:serine hydrolase [Candidatus Devosia euplotis]
MNLQSSLDQITATAVAEGTVVGGAVIVAEAGKTRYRYAFGLGDREAGRKADFDTIYRLASGARPMGLL